MLNGRLTWKVLVLALLAGSLWVFGCNSSGTGGGGPADSGSQFVASADAAGTISLEVKTNPLEVAETSSFSVRVRDQNGSPVKQIKISCDSERELAIIEPTTGVEMTDSHGHMSGVVGCRAPGSFQIGCRLPVGANKRSFVSIHCVGDVPAGFTGWPNAAGGTLGGGVDTTGDDTGGFGVNITGIAFIDQGGTDESNTIDVLQDDCPDGSEEPFFDTQVKITVVNNTAEDLEFNSYSYVVENYDGKGSSFDSGSLNISGGAISAAGGEISYQGLFLRASDGRKYFYDKQVINTGMYGFKNVRFTLYGRNSLGEGVKVSGSTSVSFNDYNNCPEGEEEDPEEDDEEAIGPQGAPRPPAGSQGGGDAPPFSTR
ncbi:MAG: hypothetical protein GX589_07415 [Deltaproteobacteria bacterium]|nr:hypothetical protein [Deltaproteobacteria bacterium]